MIMMIMVMLFFASQRSENRIVERLTAGSRTALTEAACAEYMLKIERDPAAGLVGAVASLV